MITFDRERRVFTATAGEPVCRLHLHAGCGRTWTAKVSTRDDAVCRPSKRIGLRAGQARDGFTDLPAEDLTRAGVRQALALPRQAYDVRGVVREGRTVSVDVLVRDTSRAAQCYRYVRPPDPVADQPRTTAVPVPAC
jgi:hypothetical protein